MTEVQLAEKFMEHFSDWDLYPEVPAAGVVDFFALRKPIRVAVEVKLSLNFEVIDQARKNTKYAHYSYAAVKVKRFSCAHIQLDICKAFGIGVLMYSETSGEIREALAPRLNRRPVLVKLEEWMKKSVAGSQNERMTAFKHFREEFVKLIRRKPGLTVKELFEIVPRHYGSLSSFKSCVTSYVAGGVIKGVLFREGKFYPVAE